MNSSQTYKKKVVVITSRFPYPLEKGDKLRAFYQLKELSKHYSITLISLHEENINPEHIKILGTFCDDIHCYKISKISKWFNTLFQLFTNKPFQVGYFSNYFVKKKINNLLHDIKPNHIYCQLIRAAEYVKNYHACSKTIDYMDTMSKGIERRIEKVNWFKRPIFKAEHTRLLEYEHRIFHYFEHHTIISEQDRNAIFHKDRNKIEIIPNGVDNSFFEIKRNENPTIDILFTGNMNYPPNIEAGVFLAKEITTQLQNTQLTLCGANPSEEIKALAKENVKITGWVDDIKDIYKDAKVFVAPMFIGTGLQNKLLEAMAMGIPCITTSLANNALQATDNNSILIANNKEEFVAKIVLLLADKSLQETLSKNGKEYIRKHFNWNSSTKRLVELLDS